MANAPTRKASDIAARLPVVKKADVGERPFYMLAFGKFRGQYGDSWRVRIVFEDTGETAMILFASNEVRDAEFEDYSRYLALTDGARIGPVKLELAEVGSQDREAYNVVDA